MQCEVSLRFKSFRENWCGWLRHCTRQWTYRSDFIWSPRNF